jgi:hypothetical protein
MTDFGLEFSMTTWGSPDAPKRALLLHGLQGVGQVFFKVAKILVANGKSFSFTYNTAGSRSMWGAASEAS